MGWLKNVVSVGTILKLSIIPVIKILAMCPTERTAQWLQAQALRKTVCLSTYIYKEHL